MQYVNQLLSFKDIAQVFTLTSYNNNAKKSVV